MPLRTTMPPAFLVPFSTLVTNSCAADPRLYLATGHEGLGITTSLATGKLVADQILRRATAIPFEPYLPDRKHEEHSHA